MPRKLSEQQQALRNQIALLTAHVRDTKRVAREAAKATAAATNAPRGTSARRFSSSDCRPWSNSTRLTSTVS
jgi:hypothetical protein